MILSITFSKPTPKCAEIFGKPFTKIKIKPVSKDSKISYFAEQFTSTQVFHKTISSEEIEKFIENNAGITFFNCNYKTETEEVQILSNKKGKISKIVKKIENTSKESEKSEKFFSLRNLTSGTANKSKNYILQEGKPIPFLILLGIMNPAGKVISSKYDKFRQINRFLEFIDDIIEPVIVQIKAENPENQMPPIQITDFGCGKSYLTFAVYYYLTEIKKIPINIIGLDLKKDVIKYCNSLAKQMNFSNLEFKIGNISDYEYEQNPDIIITLHACDTATDFALQYAVNHNAKAILSVPCCQHEVNAQLDSKKAELLAENSAFSSILNYGILKERFSSIVTDAIRADFLETQNYKVQLLEFIDMEHTPKNILIRAVKKSKIDVTSQTQNRAEKRIKLLQESLKINPSILKN